MAAAAWLLALAPVGVASAQPQPKGGKEPTASELALAKDMLKDAIQEEKDGKCDDALSILKQVAAIKETGEVLLHTGNCLAKGGDLIAALEAYEKAEDRARTEKDKATQQALVAKLADLRARIPAVSLQLPDDAKDPSVSIDGEVVEPGRLAKPIPLSPGEHEISAKAPGRKPFSKKLTLAEKDTTVVAIELAREDEAEGSGAPIGDDRPKRSKAPDVPLATWIAGSAAVVLTAGGIVAFVAAGSAASDGEDQCAKQTTCDDSQKDTVHQLDAAALGMWIGAGVGAGVAITFYALSRSEKPAKAEATRLVVGPRGVALRGSF